VKLYGDYPPGALDPAPGSYAVLILGRPAGGPTAVPVEPTIVPEHATSAVHVRDQVDAYRRDHPDREVWSFAVALSNVPLLNRRTDYHAIARAITRGRSAEQLGSDDVFCDRLETAIRAAYGPDESVAASVIVSPQGLDDLPPVPGDRVRRAKLAAQLSRGEIGAVVATVAGQAVLPSR
jgi:hypothetical protein